MRTVKKKRKKRRKNKVNKLKEKDEKFLCISDIIKKGETMTVRKTVGDAVRPDGEGRIFVINSFRANCFRKKAFSFVTSVSQHVQ